MKEGETHSNLGAFLSILYHGSMERPAPQTEAGHGPHPAKPVPGTGHICGAMPQVAGYAPQVAQSLSPQGPDPTPEPISGMLDDPVLMFLWTGAAQTLHEAEEMYLDASLPAVLELLAGPATSAELSAHPLLDLLLSHGSRGWEDSLL
jgi:hypothetical protein